MNFGYLVTFFAESLFFKTKSHTDIAQSEASKVQVSSLSAYESK